MTTYLPVLAIIAAIILIVGYTIIVIEKIIEHTKKMKPETKQKIIKITKFLSTLLIIFMMTVIFLEIMQNLIQYETIECGGNCSNITAIAQYCTS